MIQSSTILVWYDPIKAAKQFKCLFHEKQSSHCEQCSKYLTLNITISLFKIMLNTFKCLGEHFSKIILHSQVQKLTFVGHNSRIVIKVNTTVLSLLMLQSPPAPSLHLTLLPYSPHFYHFSHLCSCCSHAVSATDS